MKLSRKWLNEFVDVAQVGDRDFAEAMTLSGSKVEITEVLNESLKNVVVGKDVEPLIKMIIMKVDSVQEAVELPKSENAKKELYKTSDFFDEDF